MRLKVAALILLCVAITLLALGLSLNQGATLATLFDQMKLVSPIYS